jgi:putative ABC transport system permease protein
VTAAIVGADPLADVYRVQLMTQMVAEILYPRRLAAVILAVSGAVALFLATLGVYSVVSYSIAQRTGEIGVRMALGADRRDIAKLILREGRTVATIGTTVGLICGYAAIKATSSRLALPQMDIGTLIVTPLVLAAVILLACYVPARRAGLVSPMNILRRS